jgi:zinc transporter 9
MKSFHSTGFVPALAALAGNIVVAGLKWLAFAATGSSAMFAEAVHSVADSANQSLLLFGVIRARRAPTKEFEYGYGRERFFWALISACGIFFAGAGITILHALESLAGGAHPAPSALSLGVLAIAFVIEAATLGLALSSLARKYPKLDWGERFSHGDPVTVAVVYEDGVAVLGVLVAALSIWLSSLTGNPHLDAYGSLVIGGLLALIAIILIRKNHEYLIGRAMPEDMRRKILKMLESDPIIEKVLDFKSSTLGLDQYRIKCEIEVNGTSLFREMRERQFVSDSFDEMGDSEDEFVRFCVEYADRIPRIIGEHINRVEGKVQKSFPQVTHIDIELN